MPQARDLTAVVVATALIQMMCGSFLSAMPDEDCMSAIDEYIQVATSQSSNIRNKSAYFMGVLRKYTPPPSRGMPCTHDPWKQGTSEPRNQETIEPGNQGTMDPGKQGTTELGNQGTREPGNESAREPGTHVFMGAREPVNQGTRKRKDQGTREPGNQ